MIRALSMIPMLIGVAMFPMPSARGISPAGLSDEAEVRALLPAFAAAWAHADAPAIARLFSLDADLVDPTGLVIVGRLGIESYYAQAFAKGYEGSRASGTIERLRFVRADVAIADCTWRIDGIGKSNGQEQPAQRGLLMIVAEKLRGHWTISAQREQSGATKFTAP